MADRITELSQDRPITEENGTLTLQSRAFFKTITEQALIIGEGSPEDVVEAVEGATYQDRNGISGAIRYTKQFDDVLGNKKKGWVLI